MRTLAFLLKSPSETWKAFNDRLAEAGLVMQPTAARCAAVGDQPKVELIDTESDDPVVRVAVCPLQADDDAEAAQTETRLQRVLAAAEGRPVVTVDTDPPLVTLLVWPLEVAAAGADESGGVDEGAEETTPSVVAAGGAGDDQDAVDRPASPPEPPPGASPSAPPPAAPVPAASTSGRPPFGFRRRAGRLVAHAEESAIVRAVLAAAGPAGPEAEPEPIVAMLRSTHRAWLDAHWHPKRRTEYVSDILLRADYYRAHLTPTAP